MKVYIVEHRKGTSLLSKVIGFFTQSNYSHTGMYVQKSKTIGYHCELDPKDDGTIFKQKIPDYQIKKYKNIEDFVTNTGDKRTIELYEVPYKFKANDCDKILKWWKKHEKKSYGYTRLIFSMILFPLHKVMDFYIKTSGKPFPQFWLFDKGQNVCSTAVDECFKTAIGYDIFPNYPERVAYPGIFADKFKDYKVEVTK